MAPIDSTSTSQAMAKISSPLSVTVRVSKASDGERHQQRAADILLEVPVTRSLPAPKRFCQIVPALMPTTATSEAASVAARDAAAERAELRRQHDDDAGKADRQPGPMARQDRSRRAACRPGGR